MNIPLILLTALLLFVILVIRNILKAYVIYMLGDPTPKYRGLLSANPLNHIDPIGTTFLFLTPFLSQGTFIFGWTKYIDYDPNYFKNKDLSEFIVGFTGLASFFIVVFVSRILISVLPNMADLLVFLSYMSAFLLAINLIPIKGFDGAIILSVILRKINRRLFYAWEDFQYKYQLVILVMFFPLIIILAPFLKLIAQLTLKIAGW
ncbi:MAG: site-2 protease family protein [bacterium]